MSRQLVEDFLKEHYQFTSREFRDYMVEKGYKVETANKWLWKLEQEKIIKRIRRNRRITLYQSLIYREKGDVDG